MCDFRTIKQIRLIDGNKTVDIGPNPPLARETQNFVEGMYVLGASGTWHQYYDGNKWLEEGKDYIVTNYEWRHYHGQTTIPLN